MGNETQTGIQRQSGRGRQQNQLDGDPGGHWVIKIKPAARRAEQWVGQGDAGTYLNQQGGNADLLIPSLKLKQGLGRTFPEPPWAARPLLRRYGRPSRSLPPECAGIIGARTSPFSSRGGNAAGGAARIQLDPRVVLYAIPG
jgi:hypothetical protein